MLENELCYDYNYELCSFSKLSVTSSTSQLILQSFRRFTYVTAHSSTLPLLHLRHSSFSNPSFACPTSQAPHLRHLASRPWSHHNRSWWNEMKRNGNEWKLWNEFVVGKNGRNPEKNLPGLRLVNHETHIERLRRELRTPAVGGERLIACATEPHYTICYSKFKIV